MLSGRVPVFVLISPGNFSYVRTKSDTVVRGRCRPFSDGQPPL